MKDGCGRWVCGHAWVCQVGVEERGPVGVAGGSVWVCGHGSEGVYDGVLE